jgi:hypothetical protein
LGFKLFAALLTDRWKPVNVAVAAGHTAVVVATCKYYQFIAVISAHLFFRGISKSPQKTKLASNFSIACNQVYTVQLSEDYD